MNYLAHLLLASGAGPAVLGNLLGDFVQGLDVSAFEPEVQKGIEQHRALDRFTDAHPVTRRSRSRFRPRFRRFGAVLVDIFYDHFLALHFERFSGGETLESFAGRTYAVLLRELRGHSERLARVLPRMVEGNWLCAYRDVEGIDRVLHGISRRITLKNPMAEAGAELRRDRPGLETDFLEFFPQAQRHTAEESRDSPPGLPRYP